MRDDRAATDIGDAVTRSAWRVWLTLAGSLLLAAGLALLLAGFFQLIEPHVGSAAAFSVSGLIALAGGGGLFLHLRKRT